MQTTNPAANFENGKLRDSENVQLHLGEVHQNPPQDQLCWVCKATAAAQGVNNRELISVAIFKLVYSVPIFLSHTNTFS